MRTIFYQIDNLLSKYIKEKFVGFSNEIEHRNEHENRFNSSRLPPLENMPHSKNIRCPKNLNILIRQEKRNKKRILHNEGDISPFSKYYQN